MPELPELEIVSEVLNRRIVGQSITGLTIAPKGGPVVLRNYLELGIEEALVGETFHAIKRRGKYLRLDLSPSEIHLVINPKLMGRLQLCPPDAQRAGPVHVTFHLEETAEELRYVDRKRMGQLYITRDLALIPAYSELGPDALQVEKADFLDRIQAYRGEIKGILTRETLVAGIGNAYADEILWKSKIHPYRKRPKLSAEELEHLFESIRSVLTAAIDQVRSRMGEDIHLKPRDFFAVHMRAGEACPRCGTRISSITANQRITNFCRNCQPGGSIEGM